ncbi:hypothetical protein ACFYOT_39255 [Saccharothrix saharensis]|uniref:hypothetical protein n=1 Tax=Saccharothrix saharensis TaxID=571190 RepID=UPI00367E45E8
MSAPDAVFVQSLPTGAFEPTVRVGATWTGHGVRVSLEEPSHWTSVRVAADGQPLSRVALRWHTGIPDRSRVLGDAWERSYGDLAWQGIVPHRVLPWYWLAHDDRTNRTIGAGVRTRPAAWCSWTVDTDGVTLWADVRSGQQPVRLGDRELELAQLVWLDCQAGPYGAHRELVVGLATDRVPTGPIVGANNWYYAYGHGFDADAVVQDAHIVSRLAGDHPVRPFSVIDAGWVADGVDGGPWDRGKGSFEDMAQVASRIRAEGARPGLWFRPLLSRERVSHAHPHELDGGWPLDPTRPETLAGVAEDVTRFREWGFELVKHDFSTYDVLGDFAPQFGPSLGRAPWRFSDESRTTAEVLQELYEVIAAAAGDMVVLGCNTVGHLAAGLEAVHRIGDDTSGRQWERTRRMGINALAFRLPQHGAFFVADADCIPVTAETPWHLNRRFLDLVARSGTALFVSVDPSELTPHVEATLSAALRLALDGGVPGGAEPLDGLHTTTPRLWRIGEETVKYDWSSSPLGAEPFIHDV